MAYNYMCDLYALRCVTRSIWQVSMRDSEVPAVSPCEASVPENAMIAPSRESRSQIIVMRISKIDSFWLDIISRRDN